MYTAYLHNILPVRLVDLSFIGICRFFTLINLPFTYLKILQDLNGSMGGRLPKYGFKYLMCWLMEKNGDIMHVFLYRWYTSLTSLTLRYQVYSILSVWRWLLTLRSGTWGRLNFYTLYLHSTSVRSDSVTTPVSYMEVNLRNIIQECTWAYPRPQGLGSFYCGLVVLCEWCQWFFILCQNKGNQ